MAQRNGRSRKRSELAAQVTKESETSSSKKSQNDSVDTDDATQSLKRISEAKEVPVLDLLEDTGNIVPKGTITNAPKIDEDAISDEEKKASARAKREAKKTARIQARTPHTAIGRWWRNLQTSRDKISLGMSIVALGVVYGDIGTSPLYTVQAFVSGQGGIQNVDRPAVLGMLSLLFWSVTLITTVKYVLIAMRIDNKGEGGIFALFTLVRRYGKWLALPAMLGGAAFLADSVLTPAVSISSAVEGLKTIPAFEAVFENNGNLTLIITVVIIILLFMIQSRGTERIGMVFGSVVLLWFGFLAVTGALNLSQDWSVLEALNPIYGLQFIVSPGNKAGLAIMGTVFLATTGAEALYSDMGHVGRGNIYATWPFIKVTLVLCYFGQGAWLLANRDNPEVQSVENLNPFFQMMDPNIRTLAVVLSVMAGVIASQALITGAFTMVSEATGLNWMPHLQVRYPARTRGQLYIPAINIVLCVATLLVLALFRDSEHISAAYGLALTITMITTTILLAAHIWWGMKRKIFAIVFTVVFLAIQVLFLLASLTKFFHGGWFTMALTFAILFIMYAWDVGTRVERSQRRHMSPEEFLPALDALHRDDRIDCMSDNVVYLTSDPELRRLDTDIFYSIFADHPKRARAWWAVSVQVTDDPFTREYSVENFGTDFLFRVRIRIGFKVNQNVATYLHQIMHDLIDAGELPEQATIYPKLDEDQQIGTIKYILIHKNLIPESRISQRGALALRVKYAIRHLAGSPVKWFGLAAYNPIVEILPLFVSTVSVAPLKRTALRKVKRPITLQAVLAEAAEVAAEDRATSADEEAADTADAVVPDTAAAADVTDTVVMKPVTDSTSKPKTRRKPVREQAVDGTDEQKISQEAQEDAKKATGKSGSSGDKVETDRKLRAASSGARAKTAVAVKRAPRKVAAKKTKTGSTTAAASTRKKTNASVSTAKPSTPKSSTAKSSSTKASTAKESASKPKAAATKSKSASSARKSSSTASKAQATTRTKSPGSTRKSTPKAE